MNKFLTIALLILVPVFALASLDPLGSASSANMTRVGFPSTTQPVKITPTTGAAATSTDLGNGGVFFITCRTDVWLRWSTTGDAASADWTFWPGNMPREFATGGTDKVHYVSALSVSVGSSCYIEEIK